MIGDRREQEVVATLADIARFLVIANIAKLLNLNLNLATLSKIARF